MSRFLFSKFLNNYFAKQLAIIVVLICSCVSCAVSNMGKSYDLIQKGEYAKAMPYIEKAALDGDKIAITLAGRMYLYGYQIDKDYKKAQQYYDLYKTHSSKNDEYYIIESANYLKALLMIFDDKNENDSEASLIFRSERYNTSPYNLAILAQIYSFGIGETKDVITGKKLYELAMKFDKSMFTAHEYAWFLSVHPDVKFRDKKLALELIKKVLEVESKRTNGFILDTLAAVYASNGMFEQAIETQIQAINQLEKMERKKDLEIHRIQFSCRLSYYQEKREWLLYDAYNPFRPEQIPTRCE